VRTVCVIVGAGPSGLEMSRALQERGVDHVVLEKDRIAETWRTQRWDSFRLNTPGYINGMLGNVAPNDFSTAAEVVGLLEQRAAEAPIREHSPAQSMHRDGDDYVLQTPDGEYRAGKVVVATGNQNVPRIPPMSKQLPDDIHQLHAAAYRNAGQPAPSAVLVVGSAQSGCQITEDLVAAGRRVYLSTSRVGRLPWRHRGRDTIQWLDEAGFWDQRPQDLEDFDDSTPANVAFADGFAQRLRTLIDGVIERSGTTAPHAEDDAAGGQLDTESPDTVDLRDADIRSVVWCTGFTGDFSWLHLPILDDAG
jgi:putative flavoprotein involved in K+ transport